MPTHLTTEELNTRATNILPGLFQFAQGYAELIQHTLGSEPACQISAEGSNELLLEALFFCIHATDRLAFGFLGPGQRDVFIDRLLVTLGDGFERAGVDVQTIRDAYNERHREYANYKRIVGGGDEPHRGTLCWEFAKRLAIDRGVTNPITIHLLALGAADSVIALGDVLKDPEIGIALDGE